LFNFKQIIFSSSNSIGHCPKTTLHENTSRRSRIVSCGRPVRERDMVKPIFAFRDMLKALKMKSGLPDMQKITEILHFAKITP